MRILKDWQFFENGENIQTAEYYLKYTLWTYKNIRKNTYFYWKNIKE